jgi:hypothetical protein
MVKEMIIAIAMSETMVKTRDVMAARKEALPTIVKATARKRDHISMSP